MVVYLPTVFPFNFTEPMEMLKLNVWKINQNGIFCRQNVKEFLNQSNFRSLGRGSICSIIKEQMILVVCYYSSALPEASRLCPVVEMILDYGTLFSFSFFTKLSLADWVMFIIKGSI